MSRQEIDRNNQSKPGKDLPLDRRFIGLLRGEGFAAAIAAALHEDFGHTGSATKTVASITGTNERAVRNWFEAKNGPAGFHLMRLMQHSDRVLEAVLFLAGRDQVARDTTLSALCAEVRGAMTRIEAMVAQNAEA